MKNKSRYYSGRFELFQDEETGKRYWKGFSPGSKKEIIFDLSECLILNPIYWPTGTVVCTETPEEQ